MSLALEGPLRIRSGAVAALVRREVKAQRCGPILGAAGALRPVALLIRTGGSTRCFAADGATLAPADIEALRPGTLATLAEAAP